MSKKKEKLLGPRMLVDVINVSEEVTDSGIILTKSEHKEERALRGTVIKVGTECTEVKEGDVIIFDSFQGVPLKFKGVEYVMLKEINVYIIE